METEVIVALIAVGAGITAGLLGLMQALKAAKIAALVQVRLETLKAEDERRKKAYEMAVAEAAPAEAAVARLYTERKSNE